MIRGYNLIGAGAAILALSAPAAALAASTVTYTYDVFGQLVAVSSTAGRSVSYVYDAAGNRTNMTATGTTALNTPASDPMATKTPDGQGAVLVQAGQVQANRAARAR